MAVEPDLQLILRAKRGDFAARNELLRKYKPNIEKLIRRWTRAPVPVAAIQGEAMKLLLLAADKYDPNAGVLFKTFMETQMRGLYRYVTTHKNVARVPEHRALEIRRFQNAKSLLEARKDREPTHDEMADHLGWSQQQALLPAEREADLPDIENQDKHGPHQGSAGRPHHSKEKPFRHV